MTVSLSSSFRFIRYSTWAASLCFSCSFVSSCTEKQIGAPNDTGNVIARIDTFELTREEAQGQIEAGFSEEDSVAVYQEFIRKWIKNKALVLRAREKLSPKERDKSKLLEQYYNDLLIYELESKLINEVLDTQINDSVILEYYNKNKRNFELKENIVRLKFIKVPRTMETISKDWSKLINNNENDWISAAKWAEKRGGQAFLKDTIWLSFNDVLKEIPITTYNQENFLSNNNFIRTYNDSYLYTVLLTDFKIRNNLSPLSYEREKIREIIINKRKVEQLQQIEERIVRETYKTHNIEIF